MKLLFLCPTTLEAGTWFRCFYFARALVQRGHQVTLCKVSPTNRWRMERGVRDGVVTIDMPYGVGMRFSRGNTRLITDLVLRLLHVTQERYDVVHSFSHHFNAVLPSIWARLLGSGQRWVADWDDLWTEGGFYGSWPRPSEPQRLAEYAIDWSSERWLKLAADAVTVCSSDLAERSRRHGVAANKVFVVGNGVPTEVPRPPRDQARQTLGLSADQKVLLFSGFTMLDIDVVMRAVAALKKRDVRPQVLFTGADKAHVDEQARLHGVESQVRAAGTVAYQDMWTYLAAADVGLLPFADRPINVARWPIKLGDYIAARLPIATNPVGEVGRLVQETGVGLTGASDAESYADCISGLLEPDRRAACVAACALASERYSWEALAPRMEEAYEVALHGGNR